MATIKTGAIRPPKNPNLPIAPTAYQQRYIDDHNKVLRLYFNEIDNFAAGLLSFNGGSILKFPYFSGYQNGHTALTGSMTNNSTTPIQVTSTAGFENSGFLIIGSEIVQYTAKTSTTFDGTITRGVKGTTNVAHSIGVAVSEAAGVAAGSSVSAKLDSVTISNDITCTVPDSKIYFGTSGVYNIQFSMQLLNYANAEDNVTVWLAKNGTAVANSASIEQVNKIQGNVPGATILALNFVDAFNAGDYVELFWASDSGNTVLATYPPGTSPVHPASPSLILTIQFVSALP